MVRKTDPEKFYVTKDYLLPGIFFAIFVRWCVAAYPYSGYRKPPMYGDFEAQRHWQEITIHTPAAQWYHNTTRNDLQYWGLDYPPLTAYHSWIMGLVAEWLEPESVRLFASRGYHTESHKSYMRWTVFISDMYLYFTAVFLLCLDVERILNKQLRVKSNTFYSVFKNIDVANTLFLLYPGLILIDYGHFQYNCVSLGLFLWATFFIVAIENDGLATFMFVLALNYKQMELYHALPFFVYLFRKCFFRKPFKNQFHSFSGHFGMLAILVLIMFVIIWSPFLGSLESILQVIHRLFPLKRGVFEDKVSNFWCLFNVFVKLKSVYSNEEMAKQCLIFTATGCLPSCLDLFFRINRKKFVLSLINVAMAFFLFSFQVHEKTILLVAIPVALHFHEDPFMCFWFLLVSTFSMLPLLLKDGLLIPFIVTNVIYILMYGVALKMVYRRAGPLSVFNANLAYGSVEPDQPTKESTLMLKLLSLTFFTSVLGMFWLTVASVLVEPPPKYPDLFPLLVSVYSCCHFIMFFIYFNFKQLRIPFDWPKHKVKLN